MILGWLWRRLSLRAIAFEVAREREQIERVRKAYPDGWPPKSKGENLGPDSVGVFRMPRRDPRETR